MIFFGANDGMIHAVDARTGYEVWAFIPYNLLPKLRTLRDGRPVSLRDVQVGARVRASGEVRSGRLLAEEVVLLESDSGRDARSEHALTAERR